MKSMREGETNSDMFSFIASSLSFFNMQDEGIEYFHIFLLLKLSRYLGFNPQGETGDNSFFDLREGKYYSHKPSHPDYLSPDISSALKSIDQCGIGELGKLQMNADLRSNLLDAVLIYYQIHLSGLGTIKSVEVLKTVFH
jgi:DNA repair protein RecO (recombination protein O)